MKFTIEQECDCGGRYVFCAYGDADFGSATCPKCGKSAHLMNPLSVSVTAERLLYRSRQSSKRRIQLVHRHSGNGDRIVSHSTLSEAQRYG